MVYLLTHLIRGRSTVVYLLTRVGSPLNGARPPQSAAAREWSGAGAAGRQREMTRTMPARSCAPSVEMLPWAAARMEQSGYPGLVHLTEDAAERLCAETSAPPPPLHMTKIKSKGAVLTAW